jgi:hypothetical protein
MSRSKYRELPSSWPKERSWPSAAREEAVYTSLINDPFFQDYSRSADRVREGCPPFASCRDPHA